MIKYTNVKFEMKQIEYNKLGHTSYTNPIFLPLVLVYKSHNPRLTRWSSNTLAVGAFVNELARLSYEVICVTITSLWYTISLMRCYFRSICFPRLWLDGSLEFATTSLLSQYRVIDIYIFGIRMTSKSSIKNFLSHTASLAASQEDIQLSQWR